MFHCSGASQKEYLQSLLGSRHHSVYPIAPIAVWPPMPSSRTSPSGRLLLPPRRATGPRRGKPTRSGGRTAVQVDFGEGSDSIAIPRGEGHERAEGLDGTVLTGAARFMGVTLGGEFDPEGVITELQREAGRTGATLDVTPNHVIFGSSIG